MKPQDQYPFDPTFTAPYTIFKRIGSNEFFVNSQCILSNKKITVGEEYFLVDSTKGTDRMMSVCILVDCYYREGILHLILRDIRTQRVFTLDHNILPPERHCTWLMIHINYFKDRMNIRAIKSYCGCCTDPKEKTNRKTNNKSTWDDLLDFDF